VKNKLETPVAVPEKGPVVEKDERRAVRARDSRECNDCVAALEEAVKRLERKADEQEARVREDLKALEARVRGELKAVGQAVARRGQEDGAAIAAQRETATVVVEQLRQAVAGLTVVSDDRGRTVAQSRPEKRPAVKKKLETPVAAADKGQVVEKVGPEAETEGIVFAADDAHVAEGSAREASAILGTDGGLPPPPEYKLVYKKPAFLAKKPTSTD
jgi:hypothetical protein